jgi:hypothetical protein
MSVTRIEDAEQVAVVQSANIREGSVTTCRFTGANDLVLGGRRGRRKEQDRGGQRPCHFQESHHRPRWSYLSTTVRNSNDLRSIGLAADPTERFGL